MLTIIDRLITEYVAAHDATGVPPDPLPYLQRAPQSERAALAARIEQVLLSAPRRSWDSDAFEATLDSPLMREIGTAVHGSSGLWPALLPRLRNAVRLKRREVVRRLAEDLGVTDREEKVGRYYHGMEQGLLAEEGVSDRVLDALGRILGSSAETLRLAGRALGTTALGAEGQPSPVYARTASPDAVYAPAEERHSPADRPEDLWDEVDELFAGRRD